MTQKHEPTTDGISDTIHEGRQFLPIKFKDKDFHETMVAIN